ncbi:unnamed protein product [Euphydryas editha]|uniref:C-type lectin domain-containing protein n=1 Tax=Euphydryas editha TaxID=104508 RepID=A0AAU9V3J0_EUPED|nr:unnamed protein product [Euphydryas editha]
MYLQKLLFHLLSAYFCFAESTYFRFDYKYYPNTDGWLKLHLIPANWRDARLTCDLEGSVLASPTDKNMIEAMDIHWKSKNTTHNIFYTGVHATFSKGQFFSIEGVSLERMPMRWAAGEPDNADNNEECIVWNDGKIADVNCSDLFPYMCFKRRTKDMTLTPCGTIDKEYELSPLTGNCYKFHRHVRTWSRAYMTCAAEGGYLAIINSHNEAQHLKKLYEDKYSKIFPDGNEAFVHIGIMDWDNHGDWRTVHGLKIEEAGYAEWNPNQSGIDTPGLHCGAMFYNSKLNDFRCDDIAPFICEKSIDSLYGDIVE